jgi:hypothetical protein
MESFRRIMDIIGTSVDGVGVFIEELEDSSRSPTPKKPESQT